MAGTMSNLRSEMLIRYRMDCDPTDDLLSFVSD